MTKPGFTTSILVEQTPAEVFNAVNNVRGWWSEEIEGNTAKLAEIFNYHYQDVHRSKMKITEFVPNKKVVVKSDVPRRFSSSVCGLSLPLGWPCPVVIKWYKLF